MTFQANSQAQSPPPLETVRSLVNTWECDENDHLNVQFFMAHKDAADRQVQAVLDLQSAGLKIRAGWDHVRFLQELRVADPVIVRSGVASLEEASACIYHELSNPDSDAVCATFRTAWSVVDATGRAATWPDAARRRLEALPCEIPDFAHARSVDDSQPLPGLILAGAEAQRMAPTFAGVVPSDHCDADGHLTSRGLMACFSNAAPHFWTAVGLPFREIRRRQQGTVALEDLLTYGRPIRAGETLQIRSAVRAVGRKTVGFSHFVFESGSGELVARGDVTAGIMDLTARSLVELGGELGDDLTAKLRDRLIDI